MKKALPTRAKAANHRCQFVLVLDLFCENQQQSLPVFVGRSARVLGNWVISQQRLVCFPPSDCVFD